MRLGPEPPMPSWASPHCISSKAPSSTPANMRTVSELRARSDELRRMAATARTADVQAALVVLAERFDALAIRRSDERLAEQSKSEQDTRRD
jgi:hypothetical protein